MRNRSKATLLLSAIAVVGPMGAGATSPISVVDEPGATISRTSHGGYHHVCVKRPAPHAGYVPGRLSVHLWSIQPYFSVRVALDTEDGGLECFSVSLDPSESERFRVTIIDETRVEPWHSLYSGSLEAISP
jgi:hypothetical protein